MGEGIIYILYSDGVQGRGRDYGYTQDKDNGVDDGTMACAIGLLAAL